MHRHITVKELKTYLSELSDDLPIMFSTDGTGKKLITLSSIQGTNVGVTKNSEKKYIELTQGLQDMGVQEADVDPQAMPCVILWPE